MAGQRPIEWRLEGRRVRRAWPVGDGVILPANAAAELRDTGADHPARG